ncbi:MAG: type II secretion system protein [Patescibacteria group bacterium]
MRKGFTLIETIIYIALFSLVTSFVMVIFYQMLGGRDQHRNRVEVDGEANFMMQKIVWAMTGATAINSPLVNVTGTLLSVNKFNYGQNPIVFDRGANNLRISKASSTPALLGSGRVFVNEFTVEHLPAIQSAPEGVRITLVVSSADITRPAASTTLKNTIYLR